jgi:type IV pilus assembly protein PilW
MNSFTKFSPVKSIAQARGFSLVELMVGLTIGLLLTAVVTMVFIENRRTLSNQRDLSRITQSGSQALAAVSRIAKQAGQVAWGGLGASSQSNFAPPNFCDSSSIPSLPGAWTVVGPFLQGTDNFSSAQGASDELTVRYFGSSGPGNDATEPVADGSVVDCAGNAIAGPLAGDTSGRMGTRLYVANDTDGIPALFCRNFTAPVVDQVLVPGVETFQVLYGVATAGTVNEGPTRFLPATSMSSGDWFNVVALKVGMVVSGVDPTRSVIDSSSYDVFGSSLASTSTPSLNTASMSSTNQRRRIRQIFSTTIELRNSPYSTCRRS